MKKLTLFPIKTKSGAKALIGSLDGITYYCSDDQLVNGDEVIIEDSKDAAFKFLKRAASGITVEIA